MAPNDDRVHRLRAAAMTEESETFLAIGAGSDALRTARRAVTLAEQLASRAPNAAEPLGDPAISHEKIGDVLLAQGNLPGALAAYHLSLGTMERLSALDASNIKWKLYVSVTLDKIGDVLRAQGEASGALSAYRQSLAILEQLSANDASSTDFLRDLSISNEKIGDSLLGQGDASGALAAYRRDLAIAERLSAQDMSNTEWQGDLSVTRHHLGQCPLVLAGYGPRGGGPPRKQAPSTILERPCAPPVWPAEAPAGVLKEEPVYCLSPRQGRLGGTRTTDQMVDFSEFLLPGPRPGRRHEAPRKRARLAARWQEQQQAATEDGEHGSYR